MSHQRDTDVQIDLNGDLSGILAGRAHRGGGSGVDRRALESDVDVSGAGAVISGLAPGLRQGEGDGGAHEALGGGGETAGRNGPGDGGHKTLAAGGHVHGGVLKPEAVDTAALVVGVGEHGGNALGIGWVGHGDGFLHGRILP